MDGNDQPDEDHDDLPKEDASIEILSESGDSHTRDSEWSIYSPGKRSRSSITGSEMSLMEFQKLSIHSKMAMIVHHDGRQFIERRDSDDGGLPYSAEFYLNGEVWKLSGEDCFLMSPRRYIAKVTVEGMVDLDGADGFEEAVRTLLKHLKVEKVLLDEEFEECNKTKSDLVVNLDKLVHESGENMDRRRDVIMLRMLLKKHGNSLNMEFKHDLRNDSRLSSVIMSALDTYVTKALKLIQRNEFLGHLNDSSLSDQFINDAIQETLNRHRARLAAICPSSLKHRLKELPDDRLLYVTKEDMHLFTDLTTLDKARFEAVLPMIFSKFLASVQEIHDEQSTDHKPLTNRIFLYVCKSMQEVAEDLEFHLEINNAIIYSEALEWEVTQEESRSSNSKYLKQQLQMLAKLANHFEPGGPFRTGRFPYEFKLFQNMDAIPEPVRIWLCLLDDCMKDLVQADLDKMKMLSCFFKSYVSFVASEDFRSETLECLRTITHDTLRSLADMTSSQQDRTTSDSASLEYNQMISCCLGKFPRVHFGNECDQIETMLQQIICKAMATIVSSDELSKFSNEFKQLLNDLSDLQLEWFIRLTPSDKGSLLLRSQFIVPVGSILQDTYECFKVVDLEGFVEMFKLLYSSEEMPKHYQLKVIQVLLQNLEELVSKQSWNDGKRLSDKDLLDAMTVKINSIRNSLVFLKNQPDYSSFEDFLLDMSTLWTQETREVVQDLLYTDAIDSEEETLDPPIDLFKSSISEVLLKNRIKIFTSHFNKHIVESAQFSSEKRIEQIVSDVKSKIEPMHATSWTKEFIQNELPKILAGLSAVWSIIVSENDSNSEKLMKPTYQQIIYILSTFDVQESNNEYALLGIHLSFQLIEISTQQGKEFVLGLAAALLALYGHKVHIVCFNSHLTRMNSVAWIEVFRSFSIHTSISYESMKDMAMERTKGVYEKYESYINECLGFETNTNNDNDLENESENERTVLLIEDIDIILQQSVLFGTIKWLVRPTIPGLEEVQRKIFCPNKPVDGTEIDHYIKHSDNPDIRKLRAFLGRSHSYKILEDNPLREVKYTNQTLFSQHLDAMKQAKTIKEYCLEIFQAMDAKYGCLSLSSISIPYLHILRRTPLVLGFLSAPLDVSFETILDEIYRPDHRIYESNTSQTIPIKFDSEKDFLYVDSEDERDWIQAIIDAIKAASDRNCLVLVFFDDALKMEQIQQTLVALSVTVIKNASNMENHSEHYSLGDEICLLKICNGDFSKDRPVHVIQTFISDDVKEEDLIRRQAERSHSIGSYEIIISNVSIKFWFDHLKKEEITYDHLTRNEIRNRLTIYVGATIEDIKMNRDLIMHSYNQLKSFLGYKSRGYNFIVQP